MLRTSWKKSIQKNAPVQRTIWSTSSKYYCSDNKNVVGKMKDEYGGKSILKFVGLKSKMYSILDENNNE